MTTPAPQRIVSYPARPLATAQLGYNIGTVDDAHVALGITGGASIFRTQFSWDLAEDYATGNLVLQSSWSTFLASCAARGAKPLIVAAFGPPRQTIGTLTVSGTVASGSPAGTSIPVNSYGFTIQPRSTDFAGGLFFGGGLTANASYYGDPIDTAASNAITLGAALAVTLNPGDTISVQRLRYQMPLSDSDPSNAAFVRYVTWIAQQIAAAGCTGWVDVWNEFIWGHDMWSHPQDFYDIAPGWITTSNRMKAVLQQLQAASLPNGVRLVNGVSDKSGNNAIAVQNIPGSNFTHDSIHPYGDNPEQQGWDYYATNGGQWESLIPIDSGGNFPAIDYTDQTRAGQSWPGLMVTESGLSTASDVQQARWNARKLLSDWGMGAPTIIFQLDGGSGDTVGYSVAPGSVARQSYTVNQRIMAVLGRLGSTRLNAALPDVIGWPTDSCPLMAVRIKGDTPGNSVLFTWQRTWVNANGGLWPTIASPPAQSASIYVPASITVAECFDVITGSVVTPSGPTSNVLTVPVTDNPVAIRFSP